MKLIIAIIVLVAILPLIINLSQRKKPKESTEPKETTIEESSPAHAEAQIETATEPESKVDYSTSYQAKYLLTKNEWHEYRKLKQFAEAKNLQICPKVRLLDILEPRRGVQNYKSLFYKIQAKHVDFVVCDQNLYIKAIIELDDNSHNQADRQERDQFVDQILTSVGYKVIHTRAVTEETLKDIDSLKQ